MNLTQGTLLGGRIRYAQPASGYRTGIEPVLLAASIPARPGDRVLEAGTGAGAGLLCLAARVPGVVGLGLERDPDQAALAAANFAANGFDHLRAQNGDVLNWRSEAPFDHAFANPPWHNDTGTVSPVPGRANAKCAHIGLLAAWTKSMAQTLRPKGTLSLIVPAASLGEAISALNAAECVEITLLPLWPRRDAPAKILILQGIHDGRGACMVSAGLVLHENSGAFTAEANAILWDGAALHIKKAGGDVPSPPDPPSSF